MQDIIGHEEVKVALKQVLMFADPGMTQTLQSYGLSSPGGVLLYGPPGNSKTRLVYAAASQYHLPLLSVSSADVYSAYVGKNI